MMLSQLIRHLEELKELRGDVKVTTNGEFGIDCPEILNKDMICVSPACIQYELSSTPEGIDDRETTLHIGGY